MTYIDLRSDTVTLPSPAMREAMAHAELGDDVYGEDPTVNRLESLAAALVGKEAALLVSSGTMGNLCALLVHCGRGERAIIGTESHIYNYEAGGASALGGIIYHPIPTNRDGTLNMIALAEAMPHSDDSHRSQPGVVCIENTHNRCGGTVLPQDYLIELHTQTQARDLPLHMDGARMFNAAVALGVDVRAITRHVDTVQFCLSKGLSAPVGSILAGPKAAIDQARRVRKMIGGGMRQAGVIAAAGIVALTEMVERLDDDHANARALAEGLAATPGVLLDPHRVQTNIVIFELADEPSAPVPHQFIAQLREQGILMGSMGGRRVRAVTHYGISADDVQAAIGAVERVLEG